MRKSYVLLLLIPLGLLIIGLAPPPPLYPMPAPAVYSTPVGPTPTTPPMPIDSVKPNQAEATQWLGEYFNNRTLSGDPAGVRNDGCIDFNWGTSSPWPEQGIDDDSFSIRWTKRQYFEPGDYNFFVVVDDGARFWIDETLIIRDAWKDQPPTFYENGIRLQGGTSELKFEYYDHTGGAQVRFWWEKQGNYPDWKAEYFKYFGQPRFCDGPVLTRNETQINHDWGDGSPSSELGGDFWAARWTGSPSFIGGLTRFLTRTDDGVRLWVDVNNDGDFDDSGEEVIDKWVDQSARIWTSDIYLTPGPHRVKMEYYERTGSALAQLWWRNW